MKLPMFYGKESNFAMVLTRFKAYATVRGFLLAIQENAEAELSVEEITVVDVNDPVEVVKKKTKKKSKRTQGPGKVTTTTVIKKRRTTDNNNNF